MAGDRPATDVRTEKSSEEPVQRADAGRRGRWAEEMVRPAGDRPVAAAADSAGGWP